MQKKTFRSSDALHRTGMHIHLLVMIVGIAFLFSSCSQRKKEVSVLRSELTAGDDTTGQSLLGKKINFMRYAVKLHNHDSTKTIPFKETDFKIVTYGDLYCYPCWESTKQWKTHLKAFDTCRNVSFYSYIQGRPSDFDLENKTAKLTFPVFLDINERFRTVNKLGNDPRTLTFLLNKNDEIILVGPPFSQEMRDQYLRTINQK